MPDYPRKYYEEYAYVLDYLPFGYPGGRRTEPIVQALGRDYFTLFELIPRPQIGVRIGEVVYIGRGERAKIRRVNRKLLFTELTANAKAELPLIIEKIVTDKEAEFVKFFNEAGPVSPRMHALEAIPGIGKRMLRKILEERARKPFESFEDIRQRTGLQVKRAIVQRILRELSATDHREHFFFAKGYQQALRERSGDYPYRRGYRRRFRGPGL